MKERFVKRCKCEIIGKPEIESIKMTYGFQAQFRVVCPECGRYYKEIPGKGVLVTDIKTKKEIAEQNEKEEELRNAPKVPQVTTPPIIDTENEVNPKKLSFSEKMRIGKAKKKAEREEMERKKANLEGNKV